MAIVLGTNGDDILDGTANNDTVKGYGGDDVIGGGTDGEDILEGGKGNDTITDTDTVAADDFLFGEDGDDILTSDLGNDRLDGGKGVDTMTGGAGDDVYVVDNSADLVIEGGGGGTDLVEASASFTLSAEVENLLLTGIKGSSGTGNDLGNTITGNKGSNKLFGMDGNDTLDGSLGRDSLTGGLGDDFFIVDHKNDKVFEAFGEGTDTVLAFVDYKIEGDVEILMLGTGAVTAAPPVKGTGNDLDNTIIGNETGNILDGGLGADTLTGGDGDDVYIVDNAGDTLIELGGEGHDVAHASASFDMSANADEVEDLFLTGAADIDGTGNALDNVITGNKGSNILNGLGGNDTLNGGVGADVMIGGLGNDLFFVDNAADVIVENAAEGTDHAMASASFDMGLNAAEVEILTLTGTSGISGTGNAGNNTITGNKGANTIDGGAGDDTLLGAGGNDVLLGGADNDTLDGQDGKDTLMGGAGDDVYILNETKADMVVELAGEGTDEVQSGFSYTLTDEVENLTLLGNGDINGIGNALDNLITGNTGDNTLDGMAGADMLAGGGGFDFFYVDDAGDMLDGTGGDGMVFSAMSWDLSVNTVSVNNLTLMEGGAFNGTGNGADNTIIGNSAVNILMGGLGNDVYFVDAADTVVDAGGSDTVVVDFTADVANPNWTGVENITLLGKAALNATGDGADNTLIGNAGINTLDGGLGNDTYGITKGDVILDTGGVDTVMANFTYTLMAGMENITLTGTGNINAFGDGAVNTILGNTGKNTLDGMGGADTLAGGGGNDVYIVNNAGVTIIEAIGGGIDTVRSSVTHTLAANVENLVLLGDADINGTGNAGNNTITGNNGDNTLDGGGGADLLMGGRGNDVYLVSSGAEVVKDTSGNDTVIANNVSYTLGKGVENLTLLGDAVTPLDGTGNNLKNVLIGTDAANFLDGMGGADTMIGGLGDDIYFADSVADVVIESLGEGMDSVGTSVSYTLPQNVEVLILFTFDDIRGTGNDMDNTISGGPGNNVIKGLGGDDILLGDDGAISQAGSDTLDGGAGDDILAGDVTGEAAADVLIGGEGADTFFFFAESVFLPEGQYDIIRDYSLAQGDVIDLFAVFDGIFSTATDNLDDYVNVTANSFLQLDMTGSGGTTSPWVTIALLQGVHGVPGETVVDFIMPP